MFHQLIRANDSLLREFVEKYFHRALVAFEKSQREFEQYMRQALGLSNGLLAMSPVPWGANWAGMMLEPFMGAIAGGDDESPAAPGRGAPGAPTRSEGSRSAEQIAPPAQQNGVADFKAQLDQLKHEVEELRKELPQR